MIDHQGTDLPVITEILDGIGPLSGLSALLTAALAALLGFLTAKWLAAIAARLPRLIQSEWQAREGARRCKSSLAVVAPRRKLGRRGSSYAYSVTGGRYSLLLGRANFNGRGADINLTRGQDYRVVQILTAALFATCVWRFGPSPMALCAMGLVAALIVLAWIDFYSGLLPDAITLPLTWAGLLVNLGGALAPLPHAVLGAVAGYGFLWMIFHLFKFFTGRDGMGYGDFKLLAALGAWLGLPVIPWVLLAAALAGSVMGLLLTIVGRTRCGQPLPFGPYLAAAGMLALLLGGQSP